mmetsp:Transcript_32635/g.45546  ORF Transcript_32635/g.45546 Transcript_32635/m.45546 type:complete len:187 (-) Transcript_32635:1672-2232(-)
MRVWTATHEFKESWERVTFAHWIKYPNPLSSHVLTADTLERRVDPDTGCMHSTRLMKKTNRKPKWMTKMMGESNAFVVEESILDPQARTFTTYTKNVTLTSWMTVEETCIYSVSSENPHWTACKTTARVVSPVRIGDFIEKFGIERFKANSERAKQAVLYALDRVRLGSVSLMEGREPPTTKQNRN